MSRAHAARQLLALGPLTFREFVEITGWPRRAARYWLDVLIKACEVVRQQSGRRGYMFGLAA